MYLVNTVFRFKSLHYSNIFLNITILTELEPSSEICFPERELEQTLNSCGDLDKSIKRITGQRKPATPIDFVPESVPSPAPAPSDTT